jgi:hypothetical protein
MRKRMVVTMKMSRRRMTTTRERQRHSPNGMVTCLQISTSTRRDTRNRAS